MEDGFKQRITKTLVEDASTDIANYFNPMITNSRKYEDLTTTIHHLEENGYRLDSCGFMFRQIPGVQEKLEQTAIDIAILRPTNIHYHADVSEMARILGGNGAYAFFKDDSDTDIDDNILLDTYALQQGDSITVQKGTIHGFKPNKINNYLEVRLVCSGLLDPKQEIEVKKFNSW